MSQPHYPAGLPLTGFVLQRFPNRWKAFDEIESWFSPFSRAKHISLSVSNLKMEIYWEKSTVVILQWLKCFLMNWFKFSSMGLAITETGLDLIFLRIFAKEIVTVVKGKTSVTFFHRIVELDIYDSETAMQKTLWSAWRWKKNWENIFFEGWTKIEGGEL